MRRRSVLLAVLIVLVAVAAVVGVLGLLIQPEHAYQTDRHFNAAFNAIKGYGLRYGAYPYDTLTVVDPPYNGGGAGGMAPSGADGRGCGET